MYRNLLFRCLTVRHLRTGRLAKSLENGRSVLDAIQNEKHLSISIVHCKQRRSEEEKIAESHGRHSIRYSPKAGTEVVGIWNNMTVRDLASVLNKDIEHIYKALEFADKTEAEADGGARARYRPDTVVRPQQVARDVVNICGRRCRSVPPPAPAPARPHQPAEEEENKDAVRAPPAPEARLRARPPVACVMGHVDHGKTTLLDALRRSHARLVDQEFGGITQHIGAFEVELDSGERVTFLDTPGHAAFSAMRARGAGGADLVVLVVAADDGVMEQTLEAVRMAREANVPILVAVNKMDKPGANIVGVAQAQAQASLKKKADERTLEALARHGVVCEARGGDVQAVPISALRRRNLGALVEALSLQAQLLQLRADPEGPAEGLVLEADLHPRLGKRATVLVQRGTLRRGAVLVAGVGWGKVRAMQSAEGRAVAAAPPSTPVQVLGWRQLPAAGDLALQVSCEKRASEVLRYRHAQRMKEKQLADLQAIAAKDQQHRAVYEQQRHRRRALGYMRLRPEGPRQKQIQQHTHPTVTVLVKGDVDGSVEALVQLLATYSEHERVRLELAHYAVGPVTPTDIEMAEAFDAIIYAFNVECPPPVAELAKSKGLPVKQHNVIYKLVDDLKQELSRRIPPRQEEEVIGEANVAQQFLVSEGRRKVPVAGCRCTKGQLRRNELYRLVRAGQVLYEGKLASMKHLKEEVTTIKRDMECGLRLADAGVEPRPGDTLVCYRLVEVRDTTAWDPGF